MVEICMLGVGATMPAPGRGLSSAVLRCGGRNILFDCGEGTQSALRREHFSPVKTDLIALTHYHGDHIFGLPGLLQTMSCMNRTEPLYICGTQGLSEAMEPILRLAAVDSFEIRLLETGEEGIELHSLNPAWTSAARCIPLRTEHRCFAQGYRFTLGRGRKFDAEKAEALGIAPADRKAIITNPDKPISIEGKLLQKNGRTIYGRELLSPPRDGISILFSGDTRPCESVFKAAKGVDLLIHDATYALDSDAPQALFYGHSTFRQAAELAAKAQAKRLWLTHFSQAIERPQDYLDHARELFPESICASDGTRIKLGFE